MNIPAELCITDFARAVGVTRRTIVYRIQQGMIPTVRMTHKQRSRHVIRLHDLRELAPDWWQALVFRYSIAEAAQVD